MTYRFGPFRLEAEPMLLRHGTQALSLGPKVVETLLALVERAGEVRSKADLLARVWPEGFADETNLAQNVYMLRKALREHGLPDAIETVPRRGYRFRAPVRSVEAPEQPALARRAPRWAVAAAALLLCAGMASGAAALSRAGQPQTRISAAAQRLYAMGLFYWNQRTASATAKSAAYFAQFARAYPGDARGYAGLALSYAIDGDYGFGSRREDFTRTAAYAHRALAIDPRSAQALSALALAQDDEGQHALARSEYRRAIAFDPRFGSAHQWYGMSLLRSGDAGLAFAQLQQAADLDPESVAATDWLSQAAYLMRRYRGALTYARQALDLSSQRYEAYATMGMAYEALGEYPQAVRSYTVFAKSCAACSTYASPLLAHAFAELHDYPRAMQEMRIADGALRHDAVDPDDVVTALVALGRRSEALDLLRDRSLQADVAVLAMDPRMDPVRADRRFQAYMKTPG